MSEKKRRTRRRARCRRIRIGRVSIYRHHGTWWIYYRQGDKQHRRRIGEDHDTAERVAAEINAQLTVAAPTMFDFRPIGIAELCREFLQYHEHVLRSSLATIGRYATAIRHLSNFAASLPRLPAAHQISAMDFVAYLRAQRVSPNGHVHAVRRYLRDKGVQFILETCRSMYGFAERQRHLPPYVANPFTDLRIDRMRIEDAKPIFVFDADTECQFLQGARSWEFPIHFTLAKTGLRPGELCHLLIEEIDLESNWLSVRNKPELGWSVKTRNERNVPLHPLVGRVLRSVIGGRAAGVVFRRPKSTLTTPVTTASRQQLQRLLQERLSCEADHRGSELSRGAQQKIADRLWRDAGAFDPDQIRNSFLRIAKRCGLDQATCPKSWRHAFATLLQDANVDPLLRQITMGHKPSGAGGALGMTGIYTHSRPETQAREIVRAMDCQGRGLELANQWLQARPSSDDSQV